MSIYKNGEEIEAEVGPREVGSRHILQKIIFDNFCLKTSTTVV